MAYPGEGNQERQARLTGYPAVKRAQVLGALSLQEIHELERLEARTRRSLASQQRLEELWERAHELHARRMAVPRTAENDLGVYAAEVGERMRARLR